MLNRSSMIVVLTLLMLLVITGWYAARLTRIPLITGAAIAKTILSQATVIQTAVDGSVQYKGSMNQAVEASNSDVNFNGFHITYYGATNAPPWTLNSDTGTITNQNSQINLNGNINLSRPALGKAPPLLIQTESAVMYPATHQVSGTGLITFTEPGTVNSVQGTGFLANLANKTLELFTQVKSTYEAQ